MDWHNVNIDGEVVRRMISSPQLRLTRRRAHVDRDKREKEGPYSRSSGACIRAALA